MKGPLNLVLDNNERFIVDRRGEPAVVIMRAGLHPNGCAAARLADESLGRCQTAWTGRADAR